MYTKSDVKEPLLLNSSQSSAKVFQDDAKEESLPSQSKPRFSSRRFLDVP